MKTIISPQEPTDLELFARARSGDRDAYGRIVARHQTLVVSLAYGICGDFARSEDLAQEAFVQGWQRLSSLEDATKLKAWLCGIVRNLGNNLRRQQTRHADLPNAAIETVPECATEAPDPHASAVTREESAIVWRALERLPEVYREPLILFYREHQSVERVAAGLELSEDTVKQRLSRGRGMLREQVEKLVERSLGFTTPGVIFTTAVVGAIPVAASQIVAATVAGAAAKGGGATKAAGSFSWLMSLMTPFLALPFLSLASTVLFGRLVGWRSRSAEERKFLQRVMWISGGAGTVSITALMGLSWWQLRQYRNHAGPLDMTTFGLISLGLMSIVVVVPAFVFVRHRRRLLDYARNAQPPENAPRWSKKMFVGSGRALIYRSKLTILGLPFVDIRFGHSAEQPLLRGKAVGWIALGDIAHGVVFALGGFAMGGVAVGGIAVGALSTGWLAVGMVATGGVAVGGLAKSIVLSVGYIALNGAVTVGWEAASGILSVARHLASGPIAFAERAGALATYGWEKTNPLVLTFKLTGIAEIVLPAVLNAVIAVVGVGVLARNRNRSDELNGGSDRTALAGRFSCLFSFALVCFALVFGIAIGRTSRRLNAESDAAIALLREAAAKTTGEEARATARFDLGKTLVRAGRPADALAEFLWCFDDGMSQVARLAGTRTIGVLAEIRDLSKTYPPAKAALRERRDRAQVAVRTGTEGNSVVRDLVRLNEVLGEKDGLLAFYDGLPSTNPLRAELGAEIHAQFVSAKRYADAVGAEPFEKTQNAWSKMERLALEVERRRKSLPTPAIRPPAERTRAVRWLAERLEALAGAGELDNARSLLASALTYDGSPEARTIYRAGVERAGHPELIEPVSGRQR